MDFTSINVVSDLKHRYVESSAAEIVYHYHPLFFLVKAVGKCRRGRLVYYALYVKTGYFPGVFRGLALAVVKIRGKP